MVGVAVVVVVVVDRRVQAAERFKMKKAKVRSPLVLGAAVIVRTVTHYYTGRIVLLTEHEIVLDEAAWVADTGRWANALSTGSLVEVEPFPGIVLVMRGAVIDVSPWAHPLPREVKP